MSTKTVEQVTGELLVSERVNAMLCSFFAGLALLLASIGLYGLMSYSVTRRTREIGVRVALGAQQRSVRWMILRETLALTLLGVAVGIPSALAVNRLIASMLYGLSPSDLSTIVTACLSLFCRRSLCWLSSSAQGLQHRPDVGSADGIKMWVERRR